MPPTNRLVRAKGLMEPISHYTDAVVAGKTKDNKPASTLIQIGKFALDGMLVEIEAIAVAR